MSSGQLYIDKIHPLMSAVQQIAAGSSDESHIAHYHCPAPNFGDTRPSEPRNMIMIVATLSAQTQRNKVFRDGHQTDLLPSPAGSINLFDMRGTLYSRIEESFRTINFFVPIVSRAMSRTTGQNGSDGLQGGEIVQVIDPLLFHLVSFALPFFDGRLPTDRLVVDSIFETVTSYTSQRYGGWKITASTGRLTARQERLAKEFMAAKMDSNVSLAEVAQVCDLSPQHFARSFKRTTGLPPHRWMLLQRVNRAKAALELTREPLASVALSCGFADQTHLNRVFRQITGIAPGRWRRNCRE